MTYEAVCKKCGKRIDYSRSVAEREKTPICCDEKMKRVFSPTMGKVDTPAAGR
jgi:hypothetical protein